MPEISRFNGISIQMYFNDHNPPHFHAIRSGEKALISISSGAVIKGSLNKAALADVRRWATMHQAELVRNWELARDEGRVEAIEGLK